MEYKNGKIYRIVGENGLTYIGSTTHKLSYRLTSHKCHYKKYLDGESKYLTSFEIIKTGQYRIELIESFPCDSRDELNAREGHYIRQMDCVNKVIPGRTKKEYRENNREKISELKKEYYQNNKEKIKEWKNQKHECPCGGRYSNVNKALHLKSKLHQNYLNALN